MVSERKSHGYNYIGEIKSNRVVFYKEKRFVMTNFLTGFALKALSLTFW
jgi:hypothetical protein